MFSHPCKTGSSLGGWALPRLGGLLLEDVDRVAVKPPASAPQGYRDFLGRLAGGACDARIRIRFQLLFAQSVDHLPRLNLRRLPRVEAQSRISGRGRLILNTLRLPRPNLATPIRPPQQRSDVRNLRSAEAKAPELLAVVAWRVRRMRGTASA